MDISHKIAFSDAQEADHLYAYRKTVLYMHHGIAVRFASVDLPKCHANSNANRSNTMDPSGKPRRNLDVSNLRPDSIVVVEQNIGGLQIVTLSEFTEGRSLRRVLYGRSKTEVKVKRNGTCYTQAAQPSEEIVGTAVCLLIINDSKDPSWKYNVLLRNCENFAEVCTGVLQSVVGFNPSSMVVGLGQTSLYIANAIFSIVLEFIREFGSKELETLSCSLLGSVDLRGVTHQVSKIFLQGLPAVPLRVIVAVAGFVVEAFWPCWEYFYKKSIDRPTFIQKLVEALCGNVAAAGLTVLTYFIPRRNWFLELIVQFVAQFVARVVITRTWDDVASAIEDALNAFAEMSPLMA